MLASRITFRYKNKTIIQIRQFTHVLGQLLRYVNATIRWREIDLRFPNSGDGGSIDLLANT